MLIVPPDCTVPLPALAPPIVTEEEALRVARPTVRVPAPPPVPMTRSLVLISLGPTTVFGAAQPFPADKLMHGDANSLV